MAGMMREQDGGDLPDIPPGALQGKAGGGVADMAGDNLGLDGENTHEGGGYQQWAARDSTRG
jgi:hypothetical protein